MTKSRWIRTRLLARSRACFYFAATCDLLLPAIHSWFRPQCFRSAAFVRENYDQERQTQLDRFIAEPPSLDTYIFGDDADSDFVLLANRTIYGPLSAARRQVADTLLGLVAAHTAPGDVIIEFGCGDGRNLIYLNQKLPDRRYLGFELSPRSVDLCRAAASHYGCAVHFEAQDVTQPIETNLPQSRLCFSVHALEQMPRGFQQAIRNMIATQPDTIVMLEPVHELYAWSIRGFLGCFRARVLDRLCGLPRFLRSLPFGAIDKMPLGYADNPLNETCAVVISCGSWKE